MPIVRVKVMLLIFLGSSLNLLANPISGGPQFDIFKTHVDRTYMVTDHLSVAINASGKIELQLSDASFTMDQPQKTIALQQNDRFTDLSNNKWTKEWKASDLPIFCKAEHHIQKKSGIAFRFRLGSLDYVNALEGK